MALLDLANGALLTSGSGIPFVGSSPSTTLIFTNACATIMAVMPSARNDPKRSSAFADISRPRHAITQKQSRTAVAPISPSSSPITA